MLIGKNNISVNAHNIILPQILNSSVLSQTNKISINGIVVSSYSSDKARANIKQEKNQTTRIVTVTAIIIPPSRFPSSRYIQDCRTRIQGRPSFLRVLTKIARQATLLFLVIFRGFLCSFSFPFLLFTLASDNRGD
jgi:hypothetical protein